MSQFDDVDNSFTSEQALILMVSAARIYAPHAVENTLSTIDALCGQLAFARRGEPAGADPWNYLLEPAPLPCAEAAGTTPEFGVVSRWNSGLDAYTSAPAGAERPFLTAAGATLSGVI